MTQATDQATLRAGANTGQYEVVGELTFATVAALNLPAATSTPLTVDLKQVSKADSAGLAWMFEWWRRQQAVQGEIRFINSPARLLDLMRVNGLEAVFPSV